MKTLVTFAVLLLLQGAQRPTIQIGDIGRQLSAQDLADLAKVLPNGARPWLVSGEHGQAAGDAYVDAYLRPALANTRVRRGSVVELRRDRLRSTWTITKPAQEYVQVAVEGRPFDEIRDIDDINLPFRIIGDGKFTDDELVAITKVLRTAWNTGTNRVPLLPLVFAERKGDYALVSLRAGSMSWRNATLQKKGTDWVITAVGASVA